MCSCLALLLECRGFICERKTSFIDELLGGNWFPQDFANSFVCGHIVSAHIENLQIRVAHAADGLERARRERPDVILLDLNMKPMDGFEFLDQLAASDLAATPPAIIIASMVLDTEQRGRLSKVSQIVPKSDLTTDTHIAAIRQTVGTHERRPP